MTPTPRPRPENPPPGPPDDASITGTRRTSPTDDVDNPTPDQGLKAELETYEQRVERASVEHLTEHPDSSAPPLDRLVKAEESRTEDEEAEKQKAGR